jgi:hypothetical protein
MQGFERSDLGQLLDDALSQAVDLRDAYRHDEAKRIRAGRVEAHLRVARLDLDELNEIESQEALDYERSMGEDL